MFSRIRDRLERLECLILPKGRVLVFFRVEQRFSMYWMAFTRSCPRDSFAACSRI
jgi:hypothetical protein